MNLNIWAWLKKRAARFYRHRPIGSQNHCDSEDEDVLVLTHSSNSLCSCTVEMNEQYRSTTSLTNLVDDDPLRSYESEQDDASLDDSLSTVKISEFVLSSELSNSSMIYLIHEALEYERLIRTRRVDTRLKLG